MAEIRETHVERDAQGRVIDTVVRVEKVPDDHHQARKTKRGGGFGIGLLIGILLIAGAILAYAYSQGGFQQAGREADQATAQIQEQTEQAIDSTGAAVDRTADTTTQAANETSETATN